MRDENRFPPLLRHDLKNLLNPVINLSSLLLKTADKKLSEDELDYLALILKNGREMLRIIDESASGYEYNDMTPGDVSSENEKSRVSGESSIFEDRVMLVIDDDPDNLISVKAILEHDFNSSFRLIHAESGKDGIDILSQVKPDIILLDITLPDINGLVLVKSIKNFFAGMKVPVIAFTALDLHEYRVKIMESGFDDIIPKPFEIESFVEKIKKWSGEICP